MPRVLTERTEAGSSHVAGPREEGGSFVLKEFTAHGFTPVQRCLRCDALLPARRDGLAWPVGKRISRGAVGQPCPGRID